MPSVDLLEEIRAALDGVEPLIAGRTVDIEMARLRVLADPEQFRDEFASLIESAVAGTAPSARDQRAGHPHGELGPHRRRP